MQSGLGAAENTGPVVDYLQQHGDVTPITPEDFLNGDYLQGDLLDLHFSYTVSPSSSGISLASGGFTYQGIGMNFDLGGSLTLDPSLNVDLDIGFDTTGGVYILKGSSLTANLSATGGLTGSASIGANLVSVHVSRPAA